MFYNDIVHYVMLYYIIILCCQGENLKVVDQQMTETAARTSAFQ